MKSVQHILAETVSLLCKNGFQYSSTLTVQGLVGVTIDNDKVILINLNESFNKSDVSASVKDLAAPSGTFLREAESLIDSRPCDPTLKTKSKLKAPQKLKKTAITKCAASKKLKSSELSSTAITLGKAREAVDSTLTSEKSCLLLPDIGEETKITDVTPPVNMLPLQIEGCKEVFDEQIPLRIESYWSYAQIDEQRNTEDFDEEQDNFDFVSPASKNLSVGAATEASESETNATVQQVTDAEPCSPAEGRQFSCPSCEKCFTRASNLKVHQRRHHESTSTEGTNTCVECGRTFLNLHWLNLHKRAHSSGRLFACPDCEKCFSCSSTLKVHQRIHSGDRPFVCNICDKAFTAIGHLQVHQRIHTGEKPFTCKVCNKAFTQRSHLLQHMRLHTGKKPYMCEVCSKTFNQQSHLNQHMHLHTGDRPYVCGMCSETFVQATHLNTHKCKARKSQ